MQLERLNTLDASNQIADYYSSDWCVLSMYEYVQNHFTLASSIQQFIIPNHAESLNWRRDNALVPKGACGDYTYCAYIYDKANINHFHSRYYHNMFCKS